MKFLTDLGLLRDEKMNFNEEEKMNFNEEEKKSLATNSLWSVKRGLILEILFGKNPKIRKVPTQSYQ